MKKYKVSFMIIDNNVNIFQKKKKINNKLMRLTLLFK